MAIIAGFYTTFALQTLWNWFISTTFNLQSISYWQMYGILLFAYLIFGGVKDIMLSKRLDVVLEVVSTCVPKEKQDALNESLERKSEDIWESFGIVLGQIIVNTLILIIGLAVHIFLRL